MLKRLLCQEVAAVVLFLVIFMVKPGQTQEKGAAPPPARKIPGITAEDGFPRACVDCHIVYPEMNMDKRISTLMKQLNDKVEPKLLAKVQAQGLTLKGRHPEATESLEDIPAGCLECHTNYSKEAPSFGRMMHVIHLNGGEENHFMTIFQGECTHCHKFNTATGEWSLPSGPEH
jgi:hypothetical protein